MKTTDLSTKEMEQLKQSMKWRADVAGFLAFFPGAQILVSKSDRDDPDVFVRHYYEANNKYYEFLSRRDKENHCGSFFCVNELNRALLPSKHRAKEMWVRSRAVWCDDDQKRDAVRFDFPIIPNLVVNTSPGKYHYYWLTTTDNKDEWIAVMNALPEMTGTDEAVKDLPRIMRLPGFHHNKNEPYLSKWCVLNDIPYSWDEIKEAFPPNYDFEGRAETRNEFQEQKAIDAILAAENFHQAFTRLAFSKANFTQDRDVIIGYLRSLMYEARNSPDFPDSRIERWEIVMNGPEIADAVDSAIAKVKRERSDESASLILNPDSAIKYARGEKIPDNVYAPPGTLIGELTLDLHKTWWVPNLAIAGLCARQIVAYLAGGNYKSSVGDRINIQQVAIGESGCGKDLLITGILSVLQLAFEDSKQTLNSLLNGIIDEAGSAEGIDDRLRNIGDKHDLIYVHDEIGSIFKAAASGAIHKAGILNYALKMYTKSNSISNERVRAKKKGEEEASILYAPHFIISGATTPALIMEGLTAELVNTGSMSRLMFFNADHHRGQRLERIEDLQLSVELIEAFHQMVNTDMMAKGLYSMPSARIYNPKIVEIPDDVVKYCYEQALVDDGRDTIWAPVWNRRVPNAKKYAMIEAILENPIKPVITIDIMQRCMELVTYSCQYTIDLFNGSVGHGVCDVGQKAILKKMMMHPGKWWKRVEVVNVHPVVKMTPRDKEAIIQELIMNGALLYEEKIPARGKPSRLYKLTDIGKSLINEV